MVLSFRKAPSAQQIEAVVFADGFTEFEALANDFDLEFGPEHWREVGNADADQVLMDGAEGASFAIVASCHGGSDRARGQDSSASRHRV